MRNSPQIDIVMVRKMFWGLLCPLLISACGTSHDRAGGKEHTAPLTRYVDPLIGTGGHGHVFVGASVPFGMVQLGPTSIPQSWDWCSGYHESDSTVIGFPHTHLSGTGIGDLHDVTLMPVVGAVTYARGTEADPLSGLWSYSDRQRQVVRPGYYATHLLRYGIDVELTATNRVGLHKYTFPTSSESAVVFDLENGGTWDKATEAYISKVSDTTIEGYRRSTGWARDQRVYFVAEFSRPFDTLEVIADGISAPDSGKGQRLYARASLPTDSGVPLYVKVALSPTSIEQARSNMQSELPGWDFDATVQAAEAAWEAELSKVRIEAQDTAVLRTFYTALYHTMIAPSTFADANGDYLGADLQIHKREDFVNHTVFSLWDTYRAAHPLMTLIHPEKMNDMTKTMINIYRQQGKLPVWHLWANETNTMVGNPGVCVLADAILKGYVSDTEAAYEALKVSSMLDERGMGARKQFGFIPYTEMQESVAYDMEYAIADRAVAEVAKRLGKEEDYSYFLERSKSYQHLFDPVTGFMRGRGVEGRFRAPFNPVASTHRDDDYCEGNAWQYTFLVPHDLEGLVDCFGSSDRFVVKLDSLFTISSALEGEHVSPDISGLIGQYAHGNEPSHHIIYFYTMLGQPGKTADLVRRVLSELYHDRPDGLSGNEDAGQMSAWYILSALGFYQVEPAGGRYFFGSPIIDKAQLKVRDGVFDITVKGNSSANKYIRSVTLNGKAHPKAWIDFEEIARGGTLEIEMGTTPTLWYEAPAY